MRTTRLGSLYFKDSGIAGCEPALVESGPQDVASHIESTYCIGPITQSMFWKAQRSKMHYQGPCECLQRVLLSQKQAHSIGKSASQYLESIARREIDWITAHTDPVEPHETPWQYTSLQQKSPEAHTAVLKRFLAAVPHITSKDPELAFPRFWHPEFHAGSIYIDDQARITCVIDWQGAWTAPSFIGANPPLLLDYGIEMLMKLPENFKSLDDATKEKLRYQVSQSILIHTYETSTAEKYPLMNKVMRHPHCKTLKQLEAFANSTWDDNLFPLEECLISVERYVGLFLALSPADCRWSEWDHFGATQPCPYRFSPEEIRRHSEEAESFNNSQEFWKVLQGILTDKDYASNESLGQAVNILTTLREASLLNLVGTERRSFDEETRWILDLDKKSI